MIERGISRRDFLKMSGMVGAGLLLEPLKTPERKMSEPVWGMYLPFDKVAKERKEELDAFKEKVLNSGANSIVVDIKASGSTHIPFTHRYRSSYKNIWPEDPESFVNFLNWGERNKVHIIGRMTIMKDKRLVGVEPALAIQGKDGKIWIDTYGHTWCDPFRPEVGDYNAAIAGAAAALGVKEIQYDFVRFPGNDSGVTGARFQGKYTFEGRSHAIAEILRMGKEAVNKYGSKLTADFLGYTAWPEMGDLGVGQHIETAGPFVDGLCPMAYPGLYGSGVGEDVCPENCIPGSKYPYEIVFYTTKHTLERLRKVNPSAFVTPWIQTYRDGRYLMPMGKLQYYLQQKAALDAGAQGALAWNPMLNYDDDLFKAIGGYDLRLRREYE